MVCKLLCPPDEAKEVLAKIEGISRKYLDGQCNSSGFSKLWSSLLRKKVVNSELGSSDEVSDFQSEI